MLASSFDYIRKFIQDQAAIVLEPGKEYLVENRLLPVAKADGFTSVDDLVSAMQTTSTFSKLHTKVVDAMTTNETLFFRDIQPFEILKKSIIPELIAKREKEKKLTIWCGASSSGQEPYSIAMMLLETFPQLATWRIDFTASDLSESMLERCQNGVYTQLEVNRGLPTIYLAKYFEKVGGDWRIKESVRKMVNFRKINLLTSWPLLPKMDIIFIRNVLIYFDVDVKKSILAKVRETLKPDGYFFLGNGETTLMLDDRFERANFERASCYKLKG